MRCEIDARLNNDVAGLSNDPVCLGPFPAQAAGAFGLCRCSARIIAYARNHRICLGQRPPIRQAEMIRTQRAGSVTYFEKVSFTDQRISMQRRIISPVQSIDD
jgi:hypothetical protein